jgi:peptidoglycan endopeptidase LytF
MKTFIVLITIATILSIVFARCIREYKIVSGDYCYKIAEKSGLSLNQLLSLNPGLNCDNLQIGSRVCLARNSTRPPATQCSKGYRIQSGDYCYKIAKKNGLSLEQLLDMNPRLNCTNLRIGSFVCVGRNETRRVSNQFPKQPECKGYKIQSGDYCYKIAQDNGLSLDQFLAMNPGLNCDNLQIGTIVCIVSGNSIPKAPPTSPPATNPPASSCARRYTVHQGDYCYKIAQLNGLSLDQLLAINPGLNCDNLQIGASVCVQSGNNAGNIADGNGSEPSTPPARSNRIVSYTEFKKTVTSNQKGRPSYAQYLEFIGNHQSAGSISTKRELAMYLAQILLESA